MDNISHIEITGTWLMLRVTTSAAGAASLNHRSLSSSSLFHTGAKVGPRAWALRSVFVYFIQVDEAEQQCDYL